MLTVIKIQRFTFPDDLAGERQHPLGQLLGERLVGPLHRDADVLGLLLRQPGEPGADLVEVSPAYDTSGNTALLGANLLFEMLCALPGVPVR